MLATATADSLRTEDAGVFNAVCVGNVSEPEVLFAANNEKDVCFFKKSSPQQVIN